MPRSPWSGCPTVPASPRRLFGPLAANDINVDMIVQNISADGERTDLTFTVAKGDLDRALKVLDATNQELGATRILPDSRVVKVSVIGVGMRSHAGVANTMFEALAERGINIQVISTSEIKISVLISEDYLELALRSLHTAYGLDAVKDGPWSRAGGRARLQRLWARGRDLLGVELRHHGRRHDLGVGAKPGGGDFQWRRLRRDRVRRHDAGPAGGGDRRDQGADQDNPSASI